MVCIYCTGNTSVTNSRHNKRANTTWRRRQCKRCEAIFTTNEHIDLSGALMVRTSAVLQPFSRDKLFISVYRSCGHRKNAISEAADLTDTIISKLLPSANNGTIATSLIAATAEETLRHFDKAAATYYAAYYTR